MSGGAGASEAVTGDAATIIEVNGEQSATAGGVSFTVPMSWKSQAPSSSSRLMQFELPGGAEMVVSGGGSIGGSATANLDRWDGQIEGGRSDRTTTQTGGLTVHVIDAEGVYSTRMPGAPPPLPGARLIGAVVEGVPSGPVFIKIVGPRGALAREQEAIAAMLSTLKPAP